MPTTKSNVLERTMPPIAMFLNLPLTPIAERSNPIAAHVNPPHS